MHLSKAVGRNEMPLGKNTFVIPTDIVLDRGPNLPREGEIRGSEPQLAAMPPRAKLLCPCSGSDYQKQKNGAKIGQVIHFCYL